MRIISSLISLIRDYTDNIIYQKLFSGKLPTDLCYVYDNVMAQLLRTAGTKLFYYMLEIK